MKIEDRSGQEQRTGAMAKGRITPPLAPPAQLVVVTLWWAEASSASVYRRFTCKTPVLVVAGPGDKNRAITMIFSPKSHVPTRSTPSTKSVLLQGF